MLDHIKVEAYGEKMNLNTLATVLARDSQLLVASVFDPTVSGRHTRRKGFRRNPFWEYALARNHRRVLWSAGSLSVEKAIAATAFDSKLQFSYYLLCRHCRQSRRPLRRRRWASTRALTARRSSFPCPGALFHP